ncbi:MAG: heavy-metal-associated domain-containing protein [Candidatus Marinimicrobia bacterium]|nr:heavy-metal-associated domain-containing protein [Candidatus Neomarinimicrobiota bacterium]
MKHLFNAIITVVTMISFTLIAGETKEVSFGITGMTCQGCVGKVSGILDNTKGIEKYKVSIENKNCIISYDADIINSEAIKSELSKTHFTISDANYKKESSSIFSWIKNIFN